MPPMRLLVIAMAARRREERVLAGARALELKRAASVAGGDVCVMCAVKMKVWGGRWGYRASHDEAVLSLRWCYTHG